jgi:Protein kinase domain
MQGYLDPEYCMTQQLTGKTDVYSFGVVMLELVTAQPPIKDNKFIVIEVKTAFNKQDEKFLGLKDLIDPILVSKNQGLVGLDRFLDLALQCVEEETSHRPTMNEVAKEIEDIMKSAGFRMSSELSSWEKNDPPQQYSMDVTSSSSSSSRGNTNSSDFKYSGGFPPEWKLNSS